MTKNTGWLRRTGVVLTTALALLLTMAVPASAGQPSDGPPNGMRGYYATVGGGFVKGTITWHYYDPYRTNPLYLTISGTIKSTAAGAPRPGYTTGNGG